MGLVKASIQLSNSSDISLSEGGFMKEQDIRRITVTALVDAGSIMLAINETIKTQLGLKVRDRRTAQLADGTIREMEIVGPVEVRFEKRMSITNA